MELRKIEILLNKYILKQISIISFDCGRVTIFSSEFYTKKALCESIL